MGRRRRGEGGGSSFRYAVVSITGRVGVRVNPEPLTRGSVDVDGAARARLHRFLMVPGVTDRDGELRGRCDAGGWAARRRAVAPSSPRRGASRGWECKTSSPPMRGGVIGAPCCTQVEWPETSRPLMATPCDPIVRALLCDDDGVLRLRARRRKPAPSPGACLFVSKR